MVELGALLAALALSAGGFHTPPECWSGPRYTHRPASAEFVERITLAAASKTEPVDGELSPNGGYQIQVEHSNGMALVRVDVERDRQWLLSLRGAAWAPQARWVNEKLLFVRVHWGRIQASDLLLDVERGQILSHELADNGQTAYQQFQQACQGRCPCQPGQQISTPQPEPMIGTALLGLAEISGVGEGAQVLPQAIWVRAQPQTDAPARSLSKLRDFRTRELGYEQPALEVYELRGDWLQVALASGERAWIPASAARLHPLELIVLKRFTYLSRNWNGRLWSAAGASLANELSVSAGEEKTVNVLNAVRHQGRSWLHVEIYSHSPCDGGDQPRVIATGWVPAHQADGEPLVWFYSRGC